MSQEQFPGIFPAYVVTQSQKLKAQQNVDCMTYDSDKNRVWHSETFSGMYSPKEKMSVTNQKHFVESPLLRNS